MKKSQADPTTAGNLEDEFDRGEDLLDYFDVRKARVIVDGNAARVAGASTGSASDQGKLTKR